MRKVVAATLAAVMLGSPSVALAQQGTARPPQATSQQPRHSPLPAAGQADRPLPAPEDFGISLDRIRKELRELPPVTTNLLRYDFHVDVYGSNPTVDFFKDFDLSPNGPVRYGGMTHAEFLDVVTPQAYKAPAGDLIGFAMWAASQLAKKKMADRQ